MSLVRNLQHASMRHHLISLMPLYLLLLILLSACMGENALNTANTATNSSPATPAIGDTSYIAVGPKPEIVVKAESAAQITLLGSDTQQTISTPKMSLPYQKQGNKVTIDFGKTVVHDLQIKIPSAANLTVLIASGNVVVNTIQGQVTMTLANGTIHMTQFTPLGTSTIQAKNGTIDVSFAHNISCSLNAQTDFGAVASSYPTLREKRSAMKDEATGNIGSGTGAKVNLMTNNGSITVGPA